VVICKLRPKAHILTHIRCHMNRARFVFETGVDVVVGTSSVLHKFSRGNDTAYVAKAAIEVANFNKSCRCKLRTLSATRTRATCTSSAGATHIDDASVLGRDERVGIVPLCGLVACLYAEYVTSKCYLPTLHTVESLIAEAFEVNVLFSNLITYVLRRLITQPSLTVCLSLVATSCSRTRLASTPSRS
jgi:hypothetical protein